MPSENPNAAIVARSLDVSEEKEGLTGLEVVTCSSQNVSIHKKDLWRVYPPRHTRVLRECKNLRVDEIPIHDGIPHGLLHCKRRKEHRWMDF